VKMYDSKTVHPSYPSHGFSPENLPRAHWCLTNNAILVKSIRLMLDFSERRSMIVDKKKKSTGEADRYYIYMSSRPTVYVV
jgi:hypothetical protein